MGLWKQGILVASMIGLSASSAMATALEIVATTAQVAGWRSAMSPSPAFCSGSLAKG